MAGTSFLSRSIDESFGKVDSFRQQTALMIRQSGRNPLMSSSGGAGAIMGLQSSMDKHSEQYRHFRNWTYVAISRLATRIAGQQFKMGRTLHTPEQQAESRGQGRTWIKQHEQVLLPSYVKAPAGREIEVVEQHPLLMAMRHPNDIMVPHTLLWHLATNLMLTGKGHWWMPTIDGRLQIWPLPSDWVTPVHSDTELFVAYDVRPMNRFGETFRIPANEMAYFPMPDPADPLETISPLQTQAAAVSIDESIQTAQFRFFKNGIFPQVLIRTGRLPGMVPGMPGDRPVLEPDQRKELVEAVRAIYEGVTNYNEPLILDGLIEGVDKFSNSAQEMDFTLSGDAIKNRIFQAYGLQKAIAGDTENLNRATAAVADELSNANVINPMLTLIGQVLTYWAHRNEAGGEDLVVWVDPCRASDPEQKLREWNVGLQFKCVTEDEYRTEVLQLPALTEEQKDHLAPVMPPGYDEDGRPLAPALQPGAAPEKPPAKPPKKPPAKPPKKPPKDGRRRSK